ncbi:hypothetical protein ACFL1G_04005 [Planctomycetota bacterium]
MNRKKKIEQYLYAAPTPPAPDGLLEKLNRDMDSAEIKPQRSTVHRWFFPTGRSISLGRVAAAAAIALVILLPLSYGAAKVIRYFKVFEITFEYPEDNTVYGVVSTMASKGDTNIKSEEDAKKAHEEFIKLYKDGKAEEMKPGVWVVTLSSSEKFAYSGDPELVSLPDAEKKELLKKQFDEIHELKKAGKFEKIYKPEHDFEIDGVKYRYYEARYTLSNGEVVTVGESEPAEDKDKGNN